MWLHFCGERAYRAPKVSATFLGSNWPECLPRRIARAAPSNRGGDGEEPTPAPGTIPTKLSLSRLQTKTNVAIDRASRGRTTSGEHKRRPSRAVTTVLSSAETSVTTRLAAPTIRRQTRQNTFAVE